MVVRKRAAVALVSLCLASAGWAGCVGSAVDPDADVGNTQQPRDSEHVVPCTPAGCDDGEPCNGDEGCDARGDCVAGEPLADGTLCVLDGEAAAGCLAGACVASACGDGTLDADSEDCDDGNRVAGDGCELDCTFSCALDLDCDDEAMCNGAERCDANAHACAAGTWLRDDTPCGPQMACVSGECRSAVCGDGQVQEDAGEECDDANPFDGDGCDEDCTFSCSDDVHCSDFDVCTGWEWCDFGSNVCMRDEPLHCDDWDLCTSDRCDPEVGCVNDLIDHDGDGHAPLTQGSCGSDCDDANAAVHFDAEELCDGIDNNCDFATDEEAPTWYLDCDGDGFAASLQGGVNACEPPTYSPPTCPDTGTWISRRPDYRTTDCDDGHAAVRPDQKQYFVEPLAGSLAFDYDCDGEQEPLYGSQFERCFLDREGICRGFGGWTLAFIPQCGTTGLAPRSTDTNFKRCAPTGLSRCAAIASQELQACR